LVPIQSKINNHLQRKHEKNLNLYSNKILLLIQNQYFNYIIPLVQTQSKDQIQTLNKFLTENNSFHYSFWQNGPACELGAHAPLAHRATSLPECVQPGPGGIRSFSPLHGPDPRPFPMCSSESHTVGRLVGLGRENVALIRAALAGPLVISRSSWSTVARYSWPNKTTCDYVSVTLSPFHSFSSLSVAPPWARVITGNRWARRPSPRQEKAAPPLSGFSAAPYDELGWRRSDGSWWHQRGPLSPARAPWDGGRLLPHDTSTIGGGASLRHVSPTATRCFFPHSYDDPRPAVVTHQRWPIVYPRGNSDLWPTVRRSCPLFLEP
jgi:hypothetical protein